MKWGARLCAKLSSEGSIVQCSVIGWRNDACRLRKAVPKCPGAKVSRHQTNGSAFVDVDYMR